MTDAEIVAELIGAANGLMEAMYKADFESGWRDQSERWRNALHQAEKRWPEKHWPELEWRES